MEDNEIEDFQIVPATRPVIPREKIEHIVDGGSKVQNAKVFVVGIRGHYLNAGNKGTNDRLIYDDAICVLTPDKFFTFNANVDPGEFKDGVANLQLGSWVYKLGIHGLSKPKIKQYEALVQAEPVTVDRDNGKAQTGFFGINIHMGGWHNVGSEGCQTIYPNQWQEFIALVKSELTKYKQTDVPYILVQEMDA